MQVDLSISFETATEWAESKCTHTTRAEVGAGKSAKLVKIFNGQGIVREAIISQTKKACCKVKIYRGPSFGGDASSKALTLT